MSIAQQRQYDQLMKGRKQAEKAISESNKPEVKALGAAILWVGDVLLATNHIANQDREY